MRTSYFTIGKPHKSYLFYFEHAILNYENGYIKTEVPTYYEH